MKFDQFSHQEYVEIYSTLKNGCSIDENIRQKLIEKLENYMIGFAMGCGLPKYK